MGNPDKTTPQDADTRREERRQFLKMLSGGVALAGVGMLGVGFQPLWPRSQT